ncbi:hypothetical protein M413DRAFT_448863 [Hebeloma cylindrosporum]|uniref:F-box domain-containing protein n=1 Tax=Hebeloma cylindrosporum TaxID=76867 RepID=A0A0C3BZU4_HEBCY|nr:hypothetical protein M413DRAFT_448863 [Hebeloma cylindrosporum h7]
MDITRRASDKILLSIFAYVMDPPSILPPSAGDPCLVLLAVCSRWRQIILHSRNRWTNLVISPTVSSNRFNGDVEFNRCWLNVDIQRRSGYWLEVRILHFKKPLASGQNGGIQNTSPGEINILEDIVLPAAMRTKYLSLPLCCNRAAESFLSNPPGHFYFLENIEISLPRCHEPDPGTGATKFSKPVTVFQNLPFLRSASITINNTLDPLTLLLPWHQLTTINMAYTTISPRTFFVILSKAFPSLSAGFFTINFTTKNRLSSSFIKKNRITIITSLKVEHLHLRLIDPSLDHHLFTLIRFPALVTLRVDLSDSNAGWMMGMFHPILCSSSATLRNLTFFDLKGFGHNIPRPMEQDLDYIFALLPMVRRLRLPFGLYIPNPTMELISMGMLLPSLEALDVTSPTGLEILTMVKERNELAYLRSGLVGSSNAALRADYHAPPRFSEIILWTSKSQEKWVTNRKVLVRSRSSSENTQFTIHYVDQSLF